MALAMSIYSAIFFIPLLIICGHFDLVQSDPLTGHDNTTDLISSWKSSRSKRSLFTTMPRILRILIEYEVGNVVHVVLRKQLPWLANKYLPVVKNHVDPYGNVMEVVGDFVMYRDNENCIALVYFEKYHALFGVIGTNYNVDGLPYAFDENGEFVLGVVKKPYVYKIPYKSLHINPDEDFPPLSDSDGWQEFLRPPENVPTVVPKEATCEVRPHVRRLNFEQTVDMQKSAGPSSDGSNVPGGIYSSKWFHQKYYLETLVLVTRDLVDIFKVNFGGNYIAAIVRYHVIYFNAVNMAFAKLSEGFMGLTINIAKIVIEDDMTSFYFMSEGGLEFTDVTTKLPLFFRTHEHSYSPDSFDYVFVHTSRSVVDGGVKVDALTKYGRDIFEDRKAGKFFDAIPITVAEFKYFYANYAVAIHEIGRILNLKITPKEHGLEPHGQCYDMMQRGGPKCQNCFVWSEDNKQSFIKFFGTNRNHCFLLNKPRSLRPPGVHRFLTPHQLCQCFGYQSYIRVSEQKVKGTVSASGCAIPMYCQNHNSRIMHYENTILPLDGTPCATHKVCWNKECQ